MKPRLSKKRNQAWTIFEILVIIATLALLAALLLPVLAASKRRSSRINCVNNLKQINIAIRIWPPVYSDGEPPMSVSVTNGGAMETLATGNVAGCFQVMSNQLGTPKILICPADLERIAATNFQNDFNNSHISYFLNPDAREFYPQQIMDGDDNLATNGVAVKSGMVEFPANMRISFTAARHKFVGNIGYADGSVAEVSSSGLQSALLLSTNGTPTMTNRFAIP
jgi:prepilin-type processing-associated H-X9-DG protein